MTKRRVPIGELGDPPDYRFTLANERTLLAWIRTSLGLLAGGVAVSQLVPGFETLRHVIGVVLIAVGGLLALVSYRQWEGNERAMRLGEPLPSSPVPRLVGIVLALVATLAAGMVIVDLVRAG
jgi:putative membrane protein